jgi:hypothetical protein
METVLDDTNQGTPFHGEPYAFPCFGNIGPPYITTLTLLGFTVGLPIWFFSTPMVSNVPATAQSRYPPQEHQPHVDPFPSSPITSSSLYSSSSGEILDVSNQETKTKKKIKNKNKQNKQGRNQPATVVSVGNVEKPKFPCSICKGYHLLNHFPGIPKIL